MSARVGAVAAALHAVMCPTDDHEEQLATCQALWGRIARSVVAAPSYTRAVEVVHDELGTCPPGCASFEHLAGLSVSEPMRSLWTAAGHPDPHRVGALT